MTIVRPSACKLQMWHCNRYHGFWFIRSAPRKIDRMVRIEWSCFGSLLPCAGATASILVVGALFKPLACLGISALDSHVFHQFVFCGWCVLLNRYAQDRPTMVQLQSLTWDYPTTKLIKLMKSNVVQLLSNFSPGACDSQKVTAGWGSITSRWAMVGGSVPTEPLPVTRWTCGSGGFGEAPSVSLWTTCIE